MRNIKKLLTILVLALIILAMNNYVNAASDFDLEKLDFNVKLNTDGSMDVIETWQIDIDNTTNTLFKTFDTDSKKYDSITNVKVQDITDNKEFKELNQLMNHVTTDCYYGMKNNNGDFEIAWGINRSSGRRTYQISYTVNNVISVYNDCAELYWQFIGNDFEVPSGKVTGKVVLPKNVETQNNLRVWAHGPLNGEIHAISNDTVEFKVSPFIADTYLEIRLAILEPNMFNLSEKKINEEKVDSIIEEETVWANQANEKRDAIKRNQAIVQWVGVILSVGIGIFFVTKIIKNIKKIKETPRPAPTMQIEYFREIPKENENPGNAAFLYYFDKTPISTVMPKILSATMLNLALKKHIEFEIDTTQKKNEQVTVKLLGKDINDLRESEKIIYQLLSKIGNTFTMKEFEKYAQKHNTTFLNTLNKIEKEIEKENIEDKNYEKELRKIHDKYNGFGMGTFVILAIIAVIWLGFLDGGFIPVVIATIPAVIYAFTCFDIAGRIPRINTKRN